MVDRLTKTTHLTLVKVRYPIKTYAELYISRIDCLYGVPGLPHRIEDLNLLPFVGTTLDFSRNGAHT